MLKTTENKGPRQSPKNNPNKCPEIQKGNVKTSKRHRKKHQNGELNHQNIKHMMKIHVLYCQVRQNRVLNCMARRKHVFGDSFRKRTCCWTVFSAFVDEIIDLH
jgi:hypothetical protein